MCKVNIYEVGPRDGFQNVKEFIPTELKIEIVDRILASGIKRMQLTSFVSPKAIPQLRDAKEVAAAILPKYKDVDFSALVPNLYGAKAALDAGIKTVNYVVSLSKTHNKANINRTHEQSFEELERILNELNGLNVFVDIATVFGCPFEGKFETGVILDFVGRVADYGIKEIGIADTIGIANPKEVREISKACVENFPEINFVSHIHDTRNMGIVNTLASIESGINTVQSTVGGLGGCPFAPGASGNTATEDLVYMLNDMAYDTGVDFDKLIQAAIFEKDMIEGSYSSHQIGVNRACSV